MPAALPRENVPTQSESMRSVKAVRISGGDIHPQYRMRVRKVPWIWANPSFNAVACASLALTSITT